MGVEGTDFPVDYSRMTSAKQPQDPTLMGAALTLGHAQVADLQDGGADNEYIVSLAKTKLIDGGKDHLEAWRKSDRLTHARVLKFTDGVKGFFTNPRPPTTTQLDAGEPVVVSSHTPEPVQYGKRPKAPDLAILSRTTWRGRVADITMQLASISQRSKAPKGEPVVTDYKPGVVHNDADYFSADTVHHTDEVIHIQADRTRNRKLLTVATAASIALAAGVKTGMDIAAKTDTTPTVQTDDLAAYKAQVARIKNGQL